MSETEMPEEGFVSRWSKRKAAVESGQPLPEPENSLVEEIPLEQSAEAVVPPPCDEDMPPLESLNEDSDYTGFLSPNVSEALRKKALRKLFSATVFNHVDGLDDYDDDFTSFEPLGDIVTSDMKHAMEMEAKRKLEEALNADSENAAEQTEPSPEEDAEVAEAELQSEVTALEQNEESTLQQTVIEPDAESIEPVHSHQTLKNKESDDVS